jgi:hypothetical protein
MDLYAQILDAVVDAVNANAFLSAGVPAECVKEDPLIDDTDDDITDEQHRRELNEKLNSRGIVGIASVPDPQTDPETNVTILTGVITWIINKKVNKGATGARKPGQFLVYYTTEVLKPLVITILNDASVACQRLKVWVTRPGEFIGSEDGVSVWAVEYMIRVTI